MNIAGGGRGGARLLFDRKKDADKTCLHGHRNAVSITEYFVQVFCAQNVP